MNFMKQRGGRYKSLGASGLTRLVCDGGAKLIR
jgi:hypothetical protein